MPSHSKIAIVNTPKRASHEMGQACYAGYLVAAVKLARRIQPHVVYASDPLGALPGILAARLTRASLVYHEHDSPSPGSLRSSLSAFRRMAARGARTVILPNAMRAEIVQRELGLSDARVRTVWNLPLRTSLQRLIDKAPEPLITYYHGSIAPERLPRSVVEAMIRFQGRIVLRVAGYETPGKDGYAKHLVESGRLPDGRSVVHYAGQIPQHNDLMAKAAQAHVGLAFMPLSSDDLNMRHMVGASNKAFDYMAAGLALLVSDLPDWRETFVPDFAQSCNPHDAGSVAGALRWFLEHPDELQLIAERGRARIAADWNYETAFAPILEELSYAEFNCTPRGASLSATDP